MHPTHRGATFYGANEERIDYIPSRVTAHTLMESQDDGNTAPPPDQRSEWINTVAKLAEVYDAERVGQPLHRAHRAFTLRVAKNLWFAGIPYETLRPAVARVARKQLRPLLLYRVVDEVLGDCIYSDEERRHASLSDLLRCDCRKCAQESVRQSRRPEPEQ